jgi:hypothetical protein
MKEHGVVRVHRPEKFGGGFIASVREDFDNAGFKPGLSVMWHLAATGAADRITAHPNQVKDQAMRNTLSFTFLLGGIFLALAARTSIAQDIAPDALIKSVTHEIFAVSSTTVRKCGPAHD